MRRSCNSQFHTLYPTILLTSVYIVEKIVRNNFSDNEKLFRLYGGDRMEVNMSVLVEVSRQLNMDGTEMWSHMVKGQMVAGMVQIVLVMYIVVLSVVGGIVGKKWYLKSNENVLYDDYIWSIVMGALSGLLIGIVSSLPVYQAILRIFAPEYMAIRELLRIFTGS